MTVPLPKQIKRKFNAGSERTNESGPSVKKPDGICRFFSRNGTCKFGANCKFRHDKTEAPKRNKRMKFSAKEKKQVNALKIKVTKGIQNSSQDEIDELVRGFLMVRTIPRERVSDGMDVINALNTCLVNMASFAYDTGAGEGISTSEDDFIYLPRYLREEPKFLHNLRPQRRSSDL